MIQFNKRDPIYLQLIDYFREKLVSNQIKPGEELPSRREIARKFNINPNTVQRAFSEMEEMSWIYTEPHRPSRVTQDIELIQKIKKDFVRRAVEEFVSSIRTIDISYVEITELVEKEFSKRHYPNGGINK
ncbi:MAG TPA: GntR family transcriptional regulator [Atopostipes sp.]|nr:GntR family transcriptional regulator [Atopostipes sp.]